MCTYVVESCSTKTLEVVTCALLDGERTAFSVFGEAGKCVSFSLARCRRVAVRHGVRCRPVRSRQGWLCPATRDATVAHGAQLLREVSGACKSRKQRWESERVQCYVLYSTCRQRGALFLSNRSIHRARKFASRCVRHAVESRGLTVLSRCLRQYYRPRWVSLLFHVLLLTPRKLLFRGLSTSCRCCALLLLWWD